MQDALDPGLPSTQRPITVLDGLDGEFDFPEVDDSVERLLAKLAEGCVVATITERWLSSKRCVIYACRHMFLHPGHVLPVLCTAWHVALVDRSASERAWADSTRFSSALTLSTKFILLKYSANHTVVILLSFSNRDSRTLHIRTRLLGGCSEGHLSTMKQIDIFKLPVVGFGK